MVRTGSCRRHHRSLQTVAAVALLLPTLGALAREPAAPAFELSEAYALGIVEHQLDAHTEVTGWRLNQSWYIGRQNGDEDDGLSLVWQKKRDQLSISADGIRFTRRF